MLVSILLISLVGCGSVSGTKNPAKIGGTSETEDTKKPTSIEDLADSHEDSGPVKGKYESYYREAQAQDDKLKKLLADNGIESKIERIGSEIEVYTREQVINGDGVYVRCKDLADKTGGEYTFQVNSVQSLEGNFDFKNYNYLKDIIKFGVRDKNYDFDKLTTDLNSMLQVIKSGKPVSPIKATINGMDGTISVDVEDNKKTMVWTVYLDTEVY